LACIKKGMNKDIMVLLVFWYPFSHRKNPRDSVKDA